ncbi:MAG: glycoside hydrolase family 15 protein [Egibacteraceae bacterium]
MSDQPIANHAMLSDCRSVALVDRSGSIEWWCAPRFDSPSVFGRLLDHDAGHFSVRPTGDPADLDVDRRYLEGGLVLVTTFRTPSGVLELTDALAMGEAVRRHDLGAGSPGVLLRRARCVEGEIELDVELAPRFEYGLNTPLLRLTDGGLVARGGATSLRVSTTAPLRLEEAAARGAVTLHRDEAIGFAAQHTSSWEPLPDPWSQPRIAYRLEDTAAAWQSWQAEHQRYEGPYAHAVMHSGRVLQGLTYQPTGAIVAAATTSLPEMIGGSRNWDYRYTWVRDASLTMDALWVAACPDEAGSFVDYLTTAASSIHQRRELQIMFGITGERDLSERELPHLEGWRGSRPVRVGNGAWDQRQLDVYGELLAAVHRLRGQLDGLNPDQRRFLVSLAETAARVWSETDQGIWEVRGPARHYLYSKLMCWVALDRAIDLADVLECSVKVDGWSRERDRIRAAILEQGWSDEARAFTQTFGGTDLDASNLMLSIVGFLPGDDERVVATIDATQERLTDERGLVYRYVAHDGLDGEEGTFLLCTFWLAEALALAGCTDRAREVFELAAGFANDVGLLSEEVDPGSGELLGNFPQAFSHIGLVNAAWAISQAQ